MADSNDLLKQQLAQQLIGGATTGGDPSTQTVLGASQPPTVAALSGAPAAQTTPLEGGEGATAPIPGLSRKIAPVSTGTSEQQQSQRRASSGFYDNPTAASATGAPTQQLATAMAGGGGGGGAPMAAPSGGGRAAGQAAYNEANKEAQWYSQQMGQYTADDPAQQSLQEGYQRSRNNMVAAQAMMNRG